MSIPVLFGYNVRLRRQTQRALDERNRRLEETEVARTLLEERSRIARELHDVVAHHMSVIAIQAEAAPYKVPNPPPELAETFADIRASALAGLTELRRILGVLRSEQQDEMDTVPQPGLDRLGELVSNARNTGLVVHTSLSGEPRPLPSGVELSAYRIVQEALSNAMRYSPGADVWIEVSYGAEVLGLKVTNGPPRGPGAPGRGGSGHGVLGMHERVTMLGGELTARATPDGGFAVTATFPLTTGAA
jgi:signal transduction histidine kinase